MSLLTDTPGMFANKLMIGEDGRITVLCGQSAEDSAQWITRNPGLLVTKVAA
jgi:hypothetical protein